MWLGFLDVVIHENDGGNKLRIGENCFVLIYDEIVCVISTLIISISILISIPISFKQHKI